MLVDTECDLLCASMCFPDFIMCISISAQVNISIRKRLEDQPWVGNFIAVLVMQPRSPNNSYFAFLFSSYISDPYLGQ